MSLAKNAGAMSVAVMISRVLGLVREQVFAFLFGAGLVSDAYLVAFRIPNLFRDLFAEGALSSAFVTVFSRAGSEEEAKRLAHDVFAVITFVVGLWCALLFIFTPEIVHLMAKDFSPETFQLTVDLTRLLIPFLYFASSAALAMGILNSLGMFFVPSLGAGAFNLGNVIVGGGLAFYFKDQGPLQAIWAFSVGTLVGGFLQWAVMWPALGARGYRPWIATFAVFSFSKLRRAFQDPAIRDIGRLMAPAILSVAAVQINVMVNTSFATSLAAGSVSWLSYAYRIMHFPMGVFGVALSTATLPRLSKIVRSGDKAAFQNTLEEALKWTLILALGSAAGLIVFRETLVTLIYEHGKVFSYNDTIQTGRALAAFAVGLLAFNASKIFVAAFYALDSIKIPSILSLLSIGINYGLNYFYSQHFGHAGLALATAVSSTIVSLSFVVILGWQGHFRITLSLLRVFLSAALGVAGIYLWAYFDIPAKLYAAKPDLGFGLFALQALAHMAAAGTLYLLIVGLLDPHGRKLIYQIKGRLLR